MKIPALTNRDRWVMKLFENERGLTNTEIWGQTLENVPTIDIIDVSAMYVEYGSRKNGYRPHLEIEGWVVESYPEIELPYGIESITFSHEGSQFVRYNYVFDDDELIELIRSKGLCSQELTFENVFNGQQMQLPGYITAHITAPDNMDSPPIVFAHPSTPTVDDVPNPSGLRVVTKFEFDQLYDTPMIELFNDVESEYVEEQKLEAEVTEPEVDIFADMPLPTEETYVDYGREKENEDDEVSMTSEVFSKSFGNITHELDENYPVAHGAEAENEETKDRLTQLYDEKIAPHFAEEYGRETPDPQTVKNAVDAVRTSDVENHIDTLDESDEMRDQGEDALEGDDLENIDADFYKTSVDDGKVIEEKAEREISSRSIADDAARSIDEHARELRLKQLLAQQALREAERKDAEPAAEKDDDQFDM